MPTLDEIKEQISKLEHASAFGTKKEISYLPEVMQADERVKGLTSGILNRNTWLIVCTNRRVIFLDKGMVYGLQQVEIPLEKINSIEQKTGFWFGEIAIWDGSSKMVITDIIKGSVRPFVNALNDELSRLRNGGGTGKATDVADQLKKLADLKQQGILTDDEFQAQKKKLLAA